MRIQAALLLAGLLACDGASQRHTAGSSPRDSTRMTSHSINDVLQANTARLMAIEGVTGTGIGELDGKPCIIVFVREKDSRLSKKIPTRIEGYPVKIEAVGEVRPVD